MPFFAVYLKIFTNFKFLVVKWVQNHPYYIPKLQATSYLHNKSRMSSIACLRMILQDFLFPYPYVEKITEK